VTAWDKLTLVAEALDNATHGTLLGAVALALILAVAGGLTSVCIRLARNRRERTILAPLDADMCAYMGQQAIDRRELDRGTRRLVDDLMGLGDDAYDVFEDGDDDR
jgi:hypothetical protein